jgi:hypothetical protein
LYKYTINSTQLNSVFQHKKQPNQIKLSSNKDILKNMSDPDKTSLVELPDLVLSEICSFLEARSVVQLASTNHELLKWTEDWCKAIGLNQVIQRQKDDIAQIHTHPMGKNISFKVYLNYLTTLQQIPLLVSPHYELRSWRLRLLAAAMKRPKRFGSMGNLDHPHDRFDWGYPGGYWCDAFGLGYGNIDYMREVGGNPKWWALCAAGSDGGQYVRWETSQPLPIIGENEQRSNLRHISETLFDRIFLNWVALSKLHNATLYDHV